MHKKADYFVFITGRVTLVALHSERERGLFFV